jgi:hypothetical protein
MTLATGHTLAHDRILVLGETLKERLKRSPLVLNWPQLLEHPQPR